MKKFNLFKKVIVVDKSSLLQAINSQKEFGIKLNGEITYDPNKEIVIYKGKHTPQSISLTPPKPLSFEEFLGHEYKIAEQDGKIGIKAAGAWRDIVKYNYDLAMYDDTTADGIAEFSDKDLENIGWHADEFEIGYRELVDVMEERCNGTLLCIEQEEPYQFSGLGFIDDAKKCFEILFDYTKKKIENKIKTDPLYAIEKLSDDEKEAARFFKIL